MRCKYCGAEIDNDAVFCPECGKKQSAPEQQTNQRPQGGQRQPNGNSYRPHQGWSQNSNQYGRQPRQAQTNSNGINPNWLWILLMALALLVGIYFLFFHSSKKSDTRDREELESIERRARAAQDSADQAKAAAEQQLLQDSLMKAAKAKDDSLALLKEKLKNGKDAKGDKTATPAPTARQRARRGSSSDRGTSAAVSGGVVRRDAGLVVGTKNMGYGTFRGTLRNGQPHDVSGRLIFKVPHLIDSRDPKGRMAEAGDYVIGEFVDGHLVQGIWYGADRQVKGSIIIGQ